MGVSNCYWATVPPVSSYVWNQDTLHVPVSRNPKSLIHQLCISDSQVLQTRWSSWQTSKDWLLPNCSQLATSSKESQQQPVCIYLLQPVIPPLWRIWKEFLPKLLYNPSLVVCKQPLKLMKNKHTSSHRCRLQWESMVFQPRLKMWMKQIRYSISRMLALLFMTTQRWSSALTVRILC